MPAAIDKGRLTEALRRFYLSKLYPPIVCAIVFLGHVTGLEVYLNFINTLLLVGALLVCDTVRPFIVSMCTYVYQVSIRNSPGHPTFSDYYYTGWRLVAFSIVIALIIGAIVAFIIKNRIYRRLSFKNTPLLIPLLVLSCAFLLSGVFSGKWTAANLGFAAANIAVYLFAFLFIYHGLSEEESADELAGYVAYVTLCIAFLISGELITLFLTSDAVFADGSIVKTEVSLGWGIWNLVAVSLAILIPVLFYGVQNNRYPWLYFFAATVAFVMSVLTMSRNALIFSTLAYAACVLILCFVGKYKKVFRIITAVGVLGVVALTVVFFDKIQLLLGDYFERGFSDNGRYNLWRAAFDNFLSAPVFGVGFHGFDVETAVFGFLPKQAHNTVIQLLSATGVVGLLSYGYYRIMSAIPFLKRPSLMKSLFGISILVLLGESLLDNFIFNFYPMLYYAVILATVFKKSREEQAEKQS